MKMKMKPTMQNETLPRNHSNRELGVLSPTLTRVGGSLKGSYPQAKRPHLQSLYSLSRPDRDIIEEKRANDICVSTKTESDSIVNGVKVRNRGRARPKLQVREPGTDVETVRLRL
jgi:hypothetical protein